MAEIEAWEKIFKAAEDDVFFAELRYSELKYDSFGGALRYCGEPKYENAPKGLQHFSPFEGEEMHRLEPEKAYMLYEKLWSRAEEAEDARRRYGGMDGVLRFLDKTADSLEERIRIFNPIKEGLFSEIYAAEEEGGDYSDFCIRDRERESLIKAFEREKEKSDVRRFLQMDNGEEERKAITKIAAEKREALLRTKDEDHEKGGETKIEIIREKTRDRDIDMDSVTDLLTERIVDLMQRSPDGIYR